MHILKAGLLLFTLDWHLASERLLGVLLVGRELGKSLVVASLRWVGGSEWLVVLAVGCRPGLGGTVGQRRVLLKDLPVRVEGVSLFGTLREGLLLELGLVVFALHSREELRSIELIFHVWDGASKCDLFADNTVLNRVSLDVRGHRDDLARVLLGAEVLLLLQVVSHVLVRGDIKALLNFLGVFEWLLVTILDLGPSILLSCHREVRRDVLISDSDIAWSGEEHLVDSGSFLHRVSLDVAWVNDDLLWVLAFRIHAC